MEPSIVSEIRNKVANLVKNQEDYTLGELLKAFRKAHHMSLKQVAESCGKSPPTIQKYEEDIYFPALPMLKKLLDMYGISMETLDKKIKEAVYINWNSRSKE